METDTKEQAYRSELEWQLQQRMEIKDGFEAVLKLYKRSFFAKYLQGGLALLVEMLFYAIFIITLFGTIYFLFFDPVTAKLTIDENTSVNANLQSSQITTIMTVIRLMMFAFSLLWLFLGLLFRKIRHKNNSIDEISRSINGLRKEEEAAIGRMKEVLGS